MVAAVNDALKRIAARADGRKEELRAVLAKAGAERERLVEAIASGGNSFAAVRDKLGDAPRWDLPVGLGRVELVQVLAGDVHLVRARL
jgi:hypothetical protein